MKVLMVDDDIDAQRLLSQTLLRVGIESEGVRSAEEAVKHLDKFKYDAVIIDLMLPGMDGLGLLKNIRRSPHTARLKCVAVTAFHSPNIQKQALDIGFDAYFAKPVDPLSFGQDLLGLIAG
jgi:CheY-like chemotaxis protein